MCMGRGSVISRPRGVSHILINGNIYDMQFPSLTFQAMFFTKVCSTRVKQKREKNKGTSEEKEVNQW